METVDNRRIPLWQPSERRQEEEILINIPYKASPFRDELDELKYVVKNVGAGRKIDLFENIMDDYIQS